MASALLLLLLGLTTPHPLPMTWGRRGLYSQFSHLCACNNLSTCGKSCPVRTPRLWFQCVSVTRARILIWKAKQTRAFRRHFSWATVNSSHLQLARKASGRGGFPYLVSSEWSDNIGTKQNEADAWADTSLPHPWWQITNLGKAWDGGDLRGHPALLRKENHKGREKEDPRGREIQL